VVFRTPYCPLKLEGKEGKRDCETIKRGEAPLLMTRSVCGREGNAGRVCKEGGRGANMDRKGGNSIMWNLQFRGKKKTSPKGMGGPDRTVCLGSKGN